MPRTPILARNNAACGLWCGSCTRIKLAVRKCREVAFASAVLIGAGSATASAESPSVVVDIPAVHSLVAQVMDGITEPVLLLDRGDDPHEFQLRPSQARALAEADLVFWIGPELMPGLARAFSAAGSEARAISLLAEPGTRLREYVSRTDRHDGDDPDGGEEGDHRHDDDGAEGHGDASDGIDPHAWLDPANAETWLDAIAGALAAADPENSVRYAANAEAARARLDVLDAELRRLLEPAVGRPLFVFHDAYGYFADAYGLTIAGALAEGDAALPGAARVAALRDALASVRDDGPCLFAEAGHDPALLEILAEDTDLEIGILDPEGTAIAPGPSHYAATLRMLAATIAGCAEAP